MTNVRGINHIKCVIFVHSTQNTVVIRKATMISEDPLVLLISHSVEEDCLSPSRTEYSILLYSILNKPPPQYNDK